MTVFAFDFAGTNVGMRSDPRQRCLRDIFAGLKHASFTPGIHTRIGKARLGLGVAVVRLRWRLGAKPRALLTCDAHYPSTAAFTVAIRDDRFTSIPAPRVVDLQPSPPPSGPFQDEPTEAVHVHDKVGRIETRPLGEIEHRTIDLRSLRLHIPLNGVFGPIQTTPTIERASPRSNDRNSVLVSSSTPRRRQRMIPR
jgi:hypothetical protein